MYCLGIESTAHTFGIGIVSDTGKILANAKDLYKPAIGWGIKPIDAANHHKEVAEDVFEKALKEAKIKPEEIGCISFSKGPGLPPCLQAGKNFSVGLAEKLQVPLYGVNHPIAHIEIGKLTTGCKDPVVLYVSGGNTQVISFVSGKYRIFGETQDIGIGNALDKFARENKLPFPGGPEIEKLAKTICFAMLVEVTERAMAHTGKTEALLTGGVAANKRLQEMLDIMCRERGAKFYSVPKEYAMDNGAMIAWLGCLAHSSKQKQFSKADDINPTWRADDVEVKWVS